MLIFTVCGVDDYIANVFDTPRRFLLHSGIYPLSELFLRFDPLTVGGIKTVISNFSFTSYVSDLIPDIAFLEAVRLPTDF